MDEEGVSAIATLNDIGIAEVRLRDTLLRAVNANELFARTQNVAINAWKENTALTEEAGKRYATTESRLINLKNTALPLRPADRRRPEPHDPESHRRRGRPHGGIPQNG